MKKTIKWHKFFSILKYLPFNRFILLTLFLMVFIAFHYFSTKSILPTTDTKDLWFYSGLFMVLFSLLFIEPYYTSPKNVISNVIPLLLVFIAIKSILKNDLFWWIAIFILSLLLILSIFSMSFEDKNKSPDYIKNKIANKIKDLVVIIGQGKVLYSANFIFFLLTYYSIQNFYTIILFLFWFFVLCINPKKLHSKFLNENAYKDIDQQIGEIFGVQSKKIFLVKLFENRKNIKRFDIVKFRYSMLDADDLIISGIIFDTYLLNKEKWAKILQLAEPKKEESRLEKNTVYKITDDEEIKKLSIELKTDTFIGIIIDGSAIGRIKFEYSKKQDDLQESDLLELYIGNKRLFYQVTGGFTEIEKLEERNETGFIEGEAIQLGEWQKEKLSFQKFGWVPSVNTPIFKADTSNITVRDFKYPEYKIGSIPGTTLPSVVDLNEAVSHHMALLGVTGSGKSFLAREIINEIIGDTKVICIDFNNEFADTLTPAPTCIISDTKASEVFTDIDWINNELEQFGNKQDKPGIVCRQNRIKSALKDEINIFLDDTKCNIKIFELPDVSNTTGILDYTKYFFKVLFNNAKERQKNKAAKKICVVLEEAHTVIPEWNFSGSSDKTSQSLVNSIGQITLQGRKYGVGFLVIAQRTANVSKTVLTQCNTVVCFQAFDETSFNFLGNYVGKDIVQTLPNLKQYHAIVAGKAVKANIPMIVDLRREAQNMTENENTKRYKLE